MKALTSEQFLKDVANHKLTILRDDGLYRHLRFRQPDTFDMSFEIVTFKGYLVFVGDMGSYTFHRLDDMFEFFRRQEGLSLNLPYWAEKCEAADRHGSICEWSSDAFEDAVRSTIEGHYTDKTAAEIDALFEQVLTEVRNQRGYPDSVADAMYAMANIDLEDIDAELSFDDFWEYDLTDYTGRFQWCCFALPWAISVYDAAKASSEAVEVAKS